MEVMNAFEISTLVTNRTCGRYSSADHSVLNRSQKFRNPFDFLHQRVNQLNISPLVSFTFLELQVHRNSSRNHLDSLKNRSRKFSRNSTLTGNRPEESEPKPWK